MTANQHSTAGLDGEDKQLVDLVTAVLVDPNLHTDTRMRLDQEITHILHNADAQLCHRSRRVIHARALDPHERRESHVQSAPDVLASVLVDPNLHTDVRMRIHHEISEILRDASASAGRRPPGAPRR